MDEAAKCVLVDDDEDFLTIAHRLLRRACPDLQVIDFLSGNDALEYLAAYGADLVITDCRMPIMDGFEMVSAVRVFDPEVPILMMSNEENLEGEALSRGATIFLPKRSLFTELAATLERLGIHARS